MSDRFLAAVAHFFMWTGGMALGVVIGSGLGKKAHYEEVRSVFQTALLDACTGVPQCDEKVGVLIQVLDKSAEKAK